MIFLQDLLIYQVPKDYTRKLIQVEPKLLSKREIQFFSDHLLSWFEEEKRDFPWRREVSPYRVWVSEVMLQQTRASVVIPYFERWMQRFPTIEALAKSEIDEVIKLWEGLGYYSRARALHEGARRIVKEHGGMLPSDAKALMRIKGIGPYTVGAILSFAFHQKAAAVDGNVLRVIARLFAIEEEIDKPVVQKKIQEIVKLLLPDSKPWVMMEAFIEFGAQMCQRRPNCERCPLKEGCLAFQLGKENSLPKKGKKVGVTPLKRLVLLIRNKENFLLQKHSGKKIMSGLFEFPYFEENEEVKNFYPNRELEAKLKPVSHTFTRFRAQLFPSIWKVKSKDEISGFSWIPIHELKNLSFSSGHRKILTQLLEEYAHLTH